MQPGQAFEARHRMHVNIVQSVGGVPDVVMTEVMPAKAIASAVTGRITGCAPSHCTWLLYATTRSSTWKCTFQPIICGSAHQGNAKHVSIVCQLRTHSQ